MSIESAFRSFIDHVNLGRWDELAQYVPQEGRVTYNKREYHGVEFLTRMRERIGALPDGAFEVDTSMGDEEAQVVAVRIIWRTTVPEGEDMELMPGLEGIVLSGGGRGGSISEKQRLTGVHHLFCWLKNGQVSDIETIGDVDGVFLDDDVSSTTDSTPASLADDSPTYFASKADLSSNYRAYIDCINGRTMEADLPRFCHASVWHNNRQLSLSQYRHLMEDAQRAIPDIRFDVQSLIVDENSQRLAVRLEFTGVPALKWAGVEPSGKAVAFSEHVFYWLHDGRIRKVLSLVDLATYREQVRGLGLR
ncbi:hypothetical protein PpBr36_04709 [Pyricularia pennisetigena]|uniref:hypothetical protein n=1 Tax=Pyricularia pennisetigena TaxID=1578925 RepID=UPI001153EF3E|nr:hypothetical protein PpBr36_04709 [Pyricularia pennisetigena]TLS26325.1 hypothetical protein PpBr36_04709 [Pyricularia pennisetigena]